MWCNRTAPRFIFTGLRMSKLRFNKENNYRFPRIRIFVIGYFHWERNPIQMKNNLIGSYYCKLSHCQYLHLNTKTIREQTNKREKQFCFWIVDINNRKNCCLALKSILNTWKKNSTKRIFIVATEYYYNECDKLYENFENISWVVFGESKSCNSQRFCFLSPTTSLTAYTTKYAIKRRRPIYMTTSWKK